MTRSTLRVAVVTEVFIGDDAATRLGAALEEAAGSGASLAVLPELPLNGWSPATREVRDEDAEPPGGPRHEIQAKAARAAGIGLVGGAMVRDASGRRFNTALAFDATGRLVAAYRKLHLPEEEGYWETSHYEPGTEPPTIIDGLGIPLGIQICSDVNRPQGSLVLGALGAELILAPRCTPVESYERWKLVLRANAVTTCAYVISTNRPRPERGVPIGGPSVVIAPDGEVMLETTDPVSIVTLDRANVRRIRDDYPGYLPVRASLYARAWTSVASDRDPSIPTNDDGHERGGRS